MIQKLKQLFKAHKIMVFLLLLLGLYLAATAHLLSGYFVYNANIYMGLLLSPYILNLHREKLSYRFILPAISFLVLAFIVPVKSVIFLAIIFGIMFLVENTVGRINNAFLILLIVISPIFHYLSNTIGLPLRLWLSEITGDILLLLGQQAEVNGNFLIIDGQEFSVDPACTGLKMMTTSAIVALFIISYYEKKTGSRTPLWKSTLFMLSTFILNIICNLIRINLLIEFRILPEYTMHDITGIICLAVYVIVPLFVIARFLFKASTGKEPSPVIYRKIPVKKLALHLTLAMALFFIGNGPAGDLKANPLASEYNIEGFNKKMLKTGVLKFEKSDALIYIKPMCYYTAEHSPMVCWTGSGYKFEQVAKSTVDGREIYTGIMKNGNDTIHTSWWFDNGKDQTINQFNWRWKSIIGESDFYLVNVNAISKEKLMTETKKMLENTNNQNLSYHGKTH